MAVALYITIIFPDFPLAKVGNFLIGAKSEEPFFLFVISTDFLKIISIKK